MDNYINTRLLMLLLFILIIASSCAQQKSGNTTFPPYYSAEPIILKMEKDLDEISGLSFDSFDYSAVYGISDDKGTLYKVSLNNGKIVTKLKFHDQKNFEDLAIVGDSCYVLNSNGNIVSFNYKTNEVKNAMMHHIPEKGENEFEILYQDKAAANKLTLICKGCERDKKKEVSTFSYDIATGQYTDGPFILDAKEILKKSLIEKNRFKPSAAAIHPITHELYIVSSINKLLVITDTNGRLKHVYPLNEQLFKQPEGIAFTPPGDMLISNEAAGNGTANILIYKYSP